jgi:hypothetical protein
LTEQTVDLVVKLISMSRIPVMRPLVTKALRMIADLRR